MRSGRASRWTLLGLCLTAVVALPLAVLGRTSAAVAVLQLGMVVSLLTGLALDRRDGGAGTPDDDR